MITPRAFPPLSAGRATSALTARAVLAAVLAFLPCLPATAGEFEAGPLRFEEIAPAETLLYVKCSGADRLLADRENLDLFKIWAEEEVQAFIAAAREAGTELLQSRGGPVLPFEQYWKLAQGEIALAVSPRMTLFQEGAAPSMALAVDMGNQKESFLTSISELIETVGHWHGFERGRFEYRGFEIQYTGDPAKRLLVCFATIDNLFVAALNKYFLQDIIDRRLEGKATLASSAPFQRSLAKAGGGAVRMFAFVNLEPLATAVRPFWPYELEEWCGMLGLDNVSSILLASSIEGGGSRDSLYIDCPGERTGLLRALAPRPVSRECLRQAPPDTLLFAGAVFDPGLVMDEINRFVENALPELCEDMRRSKAMLQYRLGLDFEQEVFGPLGSEISFFMTLPRGGGMVMMIPDIMLTVSLDDVEGFGALTDKLLAMAGDAIAVNEIEHNGRLLTHLTLQQTGFRVPVAPTFTVESGRLIVASTPQAMKRYLAWLDGGGPSLADAPEFKEAMVGVPDNASIVKYVNMQKLAGTIYQSAAPMLSPLLMQSELPFDAALLPMTETLTQHLSSAAAYAVVDDQGILLSGRWFLGLGAASTAIVSTIDHLVASGLIRGLVGAAFEARETAGTATGAADKELVAAMAFMDDEEFGLAEELLSQYILTNPSGPGAATALQHRGRCRVKLEMYAEAIADFERYAELDAQNCPIAWYDIARACACSNEAERALEFLGKAIQAGFVDFELMDSDAGLDGIRNDPRFEELRKELAKKLILNDPQPKTGSESAQGLGYVR